MIDAARSGRTQLSSFNLVRTLFLSHSLSTLLLFPSPPTPSPLPFPVSYHLHHHRFFNSSSSFSSSFFPAIVYSLLSVTLQLCVCTRLFSFGLHCPIHPRLCKRVESCNFIILLTSSCCLLIPLLCSVIHLSLFTPAPPLPAHRTPAVYY